MTEYAESPSREHLPLVVFGRSSVLQIMGLILETVQVALVCWDMDGRFGGGVYGGMAVCCRHNVVAVLRFLVFDTAGLGGEDMVIRG